MEIRHIEWKVWDAPTQKWVSEEERKKLIEMRLSPKPPAQGPYR